MQKSIISLIALLILSISVHGQDSKKGLSRVQKIQGVEAYFLSEPLREYKVVIDKGTGVKLTSLATGGLINDGISGKASQFVKRVMKEANEHNIDIDAVIYSSGKRVVGVKFTDEGTEKNKGIGRVKKLEGVEIYVLAEPLREDYRVVSNKGGGLKMKSLVTAGVVNNSIEQDIAKMVKKVQKDTRKIGGCDALIYGAGKKASGVQFK